MSNLLEIIKKKYWVDANNDGINDKYDYGMGGTGKIDFEKNSPDGTAGKGRFDIDCSHLVNNILGRMGTPMKLCVAIFLKV